MTNEAYRALPQSAARRLLPKAVWALVIGGAYGAFYDFYTTLAPADGALGRALTAWLQARFSEAFLQSGAPLSILAVAAAIVIAVGWALIDRRLPQAAYTLPRGSAALMLLWLTLRLWLYSGLGDTARLAYLSELSLIAVLVWLGLGFCTTNRD